MDASFIPLRERGLLAARRMGTPHPGYFAKRGWILLIMNGLAFLEPTKRLQEHERTGFSCGAVSEFMREARDEADFDVAKLVMEDKVPQLGGHRRPRSAKLARIFHCGAVVNRLRFSAAL
jgi:hypothetical protein